MSTTPTLQDMIELANWAGKDTKRKRYIFFKKYISDLDYVIDHIKPQISDRGFAWHLGTKMFLGDLDNFSTEKAFIINNFETLINI